jgi:hypothetical protein
MVTFSFASRFRLTEALTSPEVVQTTIRLFSAFARDDDLVRIVNTVSRTVSSEVCLWCVTVSV